MRAGPTPPAPVKAIEENTADFLLALGRAGGGEERVDPDVHWIIGGSPIDYHNAVVRANLTADTADAAIIASRDRCNALRVPGTWHVGPSMRPPDLHDRLLAHGFAHGGSEAGMAIGLHDLPAQPPVPGLEITRVHDEHDLATWVDTLGRGFGEGPREAAWVGAMYARLGFGDTTPWRHYLGSVDGQPVATASMFGAHGVAGIYFVFTVEEARRMGIGAAMTLAPLYEARELGWRLGVLTSSPMGEGVYSRLGFEECCRIGIYEWQPEGMIESGEQI